MCTDPAKQEPGSSVGAAPSKTKRARKARDVFTYDTVGETGSGIARNRKEKEWEDGNCESLNIKKNIWTQLAANQRRRSCRAQ